MLAHLIVLLRLQVAWGEDFCRVASAKFDLPFSNGEVSILTEHEARKVRAALSVDLFIPVLLLAEDLLKYMSILTGP